MQFVCISCTGIITYSAVEEWQFKPIVRFLVENSKSKWQWPAKRFQQVLLVLDGLGLLMWLGLLGGQIFGGVRLSYRSPELWTTIGAVFVALVWSIFATQHPSWLALSPSLSWWYIALKHIAGHVPVDQRFFLEILVTLVGVAASVATGLSILRGEWNKKSLSVEVDNHEDGNSYA